jgi:hypothetical protein
MLIKIHRLILTTNKFISITTSLKKSLLPSLYQREEIPYLVKPLSLFPSLAKRGEGRFLKKCTVISALLSIFIMGIFSTSAYSSSDWKITLKVTGGGIYDYCIAGVKAVATDGHDNAWDISSPPKNPYEAYGYPYIYTYFPHAEWGSLYSKMRRDIKAPDLPKEWIFEVSSNIIGELTIQWPDLKDAIPDKKAVLVDLNGGGGEIDMQTSSSFVFYNNGDPIKFLVRISQGIPAPKPPEGLMARLIFKKWVSLYWQRNRERDLAGYNVYRSITPGSGYQRINYSLVSRKMNSYTDKQIEKGKKYYYVVTAVNTSGGESGYSNEAEVTIKNYYK